MEQAKKLGLPTGCDARAELELELLQLRIATDP